MNQCIVDLLTDPEKVSHFAQGLPIAFEIARKEVPSNAAIGILREHILTAYFISEFGEDEVEPAARGNTEGYDVVVCGGKLSIKTITDYKADSIKLRWTVDNDKVQEVIQNYRPEHDFFMVTIHWDKTRDSIFYVPLAVQDEVFNRLGSANYLRSMPTGTNHRGVVLTSESFKILRNHCDTLRQEVTWVTDDTDHNPYQRWERFWIEQKESNGIHQGQQRLF